MEAAVSALLSKLVADYPIALAIVAVIGTLRAINKPLFSLLRAYVNSTASLDDDAILDRVEKSPVTKAIVFVLDWTMSIKIPEKKVESAAVPELPKGNQ